MSSDVQRVAGDAPGRGPRASLRAVLDDLGATLLQLLHGDPHRAADVGGAVIHDPVEAAVLPVNALVLGIGVDEPDRVARLLHELGEQHAVGLVLREPVTVTPEVRAASDSSGVAVLGLPRGASWAQLLASLRSALAGSPPGDTGADLFGPLPPGDLFAIANAVASLMDAPVTLEDRNSRVLAFSGRQDEADPPRVETILGRQVPERFSRILDERGVFRQLYRSDAPIYVDPVHDGHDEGSVASLPRVAVAVRAGDEVLGSIWAAVTSPLTTERAAVLRHAADLVALHLLQARSGADVHRRLRADLLDAATCGGPTAPDALVRLGLGGRPLIVLGLRTPGTVDAPGWADGAALTHERHRLSDAFALHLAAAHPQSVAGLLGDTTYGLVPVTKGAEGAGGRAAAIAADFLDRIGSPLGPVIGVGHVAHDGPALAASRNAVDRVLQVLCRTDTSRRVARLEDVQAEELLLHLRETAAVRGDRPAGPLARLLEYDRTHDSHLVATLAAWLDAFGDVNAAAAAQYVHPNTFRYRLRRVAAVGGVDLTDPRTRFDLMLQLRVFSDPA